MCRPLLVTVLTLYCWVSVNCAQVSPTQYYVTPPSSFRGIVDPELTGCTMSLGGYFCLSQSAVLTDSNTVPSSVDLSSPEYVQLFLSWDGTLQQPSYIVFTLSSSEVTVASVGLSFLNYPNQKISFPKITVFDAVSFADGSGGTEIFYKFRDNSMLSTDDKKVATVYLDLFPASGVSLQYLRIEMSFSDLFNTDWFLLSEVTFASTRTDTPLPTISLQEPDGSLQLYQGDTLQLTCTVVGDGQFQWEWKKGDQVLVEGNSQIQMETALATRTSVLTITDVCASDSGNYTCEAVHVVNSLIMESSTTVVTIPSDVQVEVSPPVTGLLDATTELTCQINGYQGDPTDITWARENPDTPLTDSPPKYTVVYSSQTIGSDSSGCSRVSVNVTLTIHNLISGDAGNYFCRAGTDAQATTTLTVQDPNQPTPSPTSSTSSTPSSSTNASETVPSRPPSGSSGSSGDGGAIAGGVVVSVVFIIVALATVIITVVLIKRRSPTAKVEHREQHQNGDAQTHRRSRKYTSEDIEWQLYSSVDKPRAPPVPPQNFDLTDVGKPADKSYERHELDQTKLDESLPRLPPRRTTSFSQGKPKLAKLSGDVRKYVMRDNPLYQSGEDVDTVGTDETSFTDELELHIYADPALERSHAVTPTTVYSSSGGEEPIYSEALDPNMFSNEPSSTDDDLHPYGPIYADPQPLLRSEAPLEVTHDQIQEVKTLGIGEFGAVVLAKTIGISLKDLKLSTTDDNRSVQINVAVKKLKPHAQVSIRTSFEREIKFMSRLKDENIVRLLAICTSDSPFIVMEYMENGDLNQYLQKHELAKTDSVILANQLPVSLLVYMAVQVASGMRYLASLNFVHRDMASRNCLVGKNFTVKIADFGMSKSLYEHSYYRVRGRAKLPIRWMATECFYGRFSEKSDIWAFGVTMWEIFMLAKRQPYEELEDQEMIQDAVLGASRQLLGKPESCPPEVYEVMLRCWEYQPECRTDFSETFTSLAAIHRQM